MLKKIFLLIAALLLAAIVVTSVVSFRMLAQNHEQNEYQKLLSAARLADEQLRLGATPQQAGNAVLRAFQDNEGSIRVTIIDRQGKVLSETAADAEPVNHENRPEIRQAFASSSYALSSRKSTSLNATLLYVALYVAGQDVVVRTAMPLSAVRSGMTAALMRIVGVLIASLLILALLARVFVGRIIRPLEELNASAQAMAAGQYDVRVHQLLEDSNEITSLGTAFNTMAEQLERTVHDLEERNARLDVILDTMADPLLAVSAEGNVTFMNGQARQIFGRGPESHGTAVPLMLITHSGESEELARQAIRDRTRLRAELTLRGEMGLSTFQVIASPILARGLEGVIMTFHDMTEVRRLQKMRSDFVANVTHELRTPLTSIRGFIETLRNGAIRNPSVADRFLEIIDIESERLHQLITDILALSEIEELKEDRETEMFDLNALIDDVADLLDDLAAEHKVTIVVDHDENALPVRASRDRLKQVLINLIDNAVKYSRPGGRVEVWAVRQPEDRRIRLTVHDDGVGIDAEHQARIFERFYRVDKSRSRELGGTGLGLSIVKHIAQLYGGEASVSSKPGVGSTFTVLLSI